MVKRLVLLGLVAAFAALVVAGCGDGGGGLDLDDCGNGTIDSGEECDDGNLSDVDDCLSTCQTARCGDGFVNDGVEACEIGIIPKTCADLGFASGTPTCTTSCTFDTGSCSGNAPVPTPTPARTAGGPTATPEPGATPTPTSTVEPTAQPTPVGSTCSDGDAIVVTLSLDAEVSSARLDLGYPTSANIPGSGTEAAVKSRVVFTGSGLTVVNDFDQSGDLVDDTLTASLAGSDLVPAGLFVTITFDCVAGQPAPSAGDFQCAVVSASQQGNPVTPTCTVGIQ
jgi:cysteine-rich repeat protein